jgi:hypothetical protein
VLHPFANFVALRTSESRNPRLALAKQSLFSRDRQEAADDVATERWCDVAGRRTGLQLGVSVMGEGADNDKKGRNQSCESGIHERYRSGKNGGMAKMGNAS